MYDPNDTTFDEEQFIRDHLNFLNESDDDFSESLENSSIQFKSYEENKSIYGISPISSKVSETWSSSSSGSITSPREATGPRSSNAYSNTVLPSTSTFSKEDWYSPFFLEDISFGQESTNSGRSKELDSFLYKVWSDTFANKSSDFLRESIFQKESLFSATNSIDARMQAHNAYSQLAYEMWPYTNVATAASTNFVARTSELPLNYLNPCFNSRCTNEPCLGSCNLASSLRGGVTLPVFSTSHTSHPMCGPEDALNKYFAHLEMKKLPHEPDLSSARSEFSLPIGRTSTPINNSSRENRPQQFAVEQTSGDVAGALTPEDFIRQFANPSVSNRKSPESLSLEDFVRPENKATNTTKPGKSSRSTKQYDFCKFCYKNGELSDIYMSHVTKSSNGTIVCPILRKYVCDICGATGDKAHTRKYCSFNTQQNRRHPVFRRLTNGVLTSCHNHK